MYKTLNHPCNYGVNLPICKVRYRFFAIRKLLTLKFIG